MTARRFLTAWLVMLLVAIANGTVRDLTYGRRLDELTAHQLSTASAILLLGLVIGAVVRRHPPASARQALAIGLGWMTLTVAFEFLGFHVLGGHPWAELLANYDLTAGRVWVVLLAWLAIAPLLFYRCRRAG